MYVDEIRAYTPQNEQEAADQRLILEYIRLFPDNILTRDNEIAHLSSSGFVVNADGTRVLMAHHNIYRVWAWTGGHADGEGDLLSVALREAREETGLTLTSYRFRGLVTFIPDEKTSEYMCLYTADGWEGEMTDCSEGKLEWVEKEKIGSLNLWEGDKIFMKLLKEEKPFFSLKLRYEGDLLKEAVLDGKEIPLPLGKEWE